MRRHSTYRIHGCICKTLHTKQVAMVDGVEGDHGQVEKNMSGKLSSKIMCVFFYQLRQMKNIP